MMHYERDYGAARFAFSVLELVSWTVILSGVLLAIAGFWTGGAFGLLQSDSHISIRLLAALPGIGATIGGLIGVALAQSSRATVDTAEMTRDMLAIMKRGSLPAPAQSQEPAVEPDAPAGVLSSEETDEQEAYPPIVENYRGIDITERSDGFYIRDRRFPSDVDARAFVDSALDRQAIKAER